MFHWAMIMGERVAKSSMIFEVRRKQPRDRRAPNRSSFSGQRGLWPKSRPQHATRLEPNPQHEGICSLMIGRGYLLKTLMFSMSLLTSRKSPWKLELYPSQTSQLASGVKKNICKWHHKVLAGPMVEVQKRVTPMFSKWGFRVSAINSQFHAAFSS